MTLQCSQIALTLGRTFTTVLSSCGVLACGGVLAALNLLQAE
jgi:hypothetical protein